MEDSLWPVCPPAEGSLYCPQVRGGGSGHTVSDFVSIDNLLVITLCVNMFFCCCLFFFFCYCCLFFADLSHRRGGEGMRAGDELLEGLEEGLLGGGKRLVGSTETDQISWFILT